MVTESDLQLSDGRSLHIYDSGPSARLTVFWHHGTPNIGAPPAPLFPQAAAHGIRWVAYDRPGYCGSPARPGRDVASAAADVAGIADALGIERFAVMGHSGGGPHALACAALLPERVLAAVDIAGLAPADAAGLDWFAGMRDPGTVRAAAVGRAALEAHLATSEFDPDVFTPTDHAALRGGWSWFDDVVGPAVAGGPDGMVDDELAYVGPWGFDPATITAPTLLVYGGADRMVPIAHGEWLAQRCSTAELWRRPDDGHISVMDAGGDALDWIAEQ